MYKKILVPLDGSRRAEAIMPHVEELAQQQENEVVLLQIIEPAMTVADPYSAISDYRAYMQITAEDTAEAKRYLARWQGALNAKGIRAITVVENGPVVKHILAVAAREGADLIAMASHGRTGLSRVFYGSVASGLLNQADRPLLLIRAATDEWGADEWGAEAQVEAVQREPVQREPVQREPA
jgi:nucleotide-binding universal stress UspA family protein